MCGIKEHFKNLIMSDELSDSAVEDILKADLSYDELIKNIELEIDLDNIGSKYKVNEASLLDFYSIPLNQYKFRVINLYKYDSQPGKAPIIENSRRFCRQLYVRTINEDNYLTYQELQSLSNPGSKYGVNDILRYCGNYTTDSAYASCRHRFIRYKYDTKTGNIIRDTVQPPYTRSISKR